MAERHLRRVHPRWAPVTRTSFSLLPTLITDVRARAVTPRAPSTRHLELVRELARELAREPDGGPGAPWASRALHACLTHLLTSTVTEASQVRIVDAWTDGDDEADDGICVVYRPPHDEGRVVGVRRRRRDVLQPSDWRIGDMTTWGYDMGADSGDDMGADSGDEIEPTDLVDPERFGWNMADFDLGEPLGYVTTVLRYDSADVGWWGNLDAVLPVPPNATRG